MLLTEIHAAAALLTKIEELRLQGDQASRLAIGLREISRHYAVPRIMSPGLQAIAVFGVTYANVLRENFVARPPARAPAQPAGPPPGTLATDNVAAFPTPTAGGWGTVRSIMPFSARTGPGKPSGRLTCCPDGHSIKCPGLRLTRSVTR